MADQRKALADTTEFTDTVYFVNPTGIQTLNPWVSKQQHCIFALRWTGLWRRIKHYTTLANNLFKTYNTWSVFLKSGNIHYYEFSTSGPKSAKLCDCVLYILCHTFCPGDNCKDTSPIYLCWRPTLEIGVLPWFVLILCTSNVRAIDFSLLINLPCSLVPSTATLSFVVLVHHWQSEQWLSHHYTFYYS